MYRVLNQPWLYRASQALLIPGSTGAVGGKIESLLRDLPQTDRLLDVGCGPASPLWRHGLRPVGVDLCPAYVEHYRRRGGQAVVGTVDEMPFPDKAFGGVWCLGVLHHVPDSVARQALREMLRVRTPEGYVAILDSVRPEPAWRRPIAWLLRWLDRGRYVRTEGELRALLPQDYPWKVQRFTYGLYRLEALTITLRGNSGSE